MSRIVFLAVLALLLPTCSGAEGGRALVDLPRATIRVGGHVVQVQVASTPAQLRTGLMFRPQLPENEGMLFVHDADQVRCMWMKNTLIPLTAAFLDSDGRIVNLAPMTPLDTRRHCSEGPVRYVLEMNLNWFERRALREGAVVDLSNVGGGPLSPLPPRSH